MVRKVLIYEDPHLSSKNYGNHKDYKEESLDNFKNVTKVAEEINADYIICGGDLTYSNFHKLEYRERVDNELARQSKITNGNVYIVEGNHDRSTGGMTECEYYTKKGVLKQTDYIDIGKLHISMMKNGDVGQFKPNIVEGDINVLIAHDYLKFKDTQLPNFGTAVDLDKMSDFYGLNYIICGHIHKTMVFKGGIEKNGRIKETIVHYPGCPVRPSFQGEDTDTEGQYIILEIDDEDETCQSFKYDIYKFDLPPVEEVFNIEIITERKEKKEIKESRVDISEVLSELSKHRMNIGNPEDIISTMDVDDKYKDKAIRLLNEA